MKLTPKIKKQIDDYFDNITPEELVTKLEERGWEFEDIDNVNNKTMEKPISKTRTITYLDYRECRDYISDKYNISGRNMQKFWNYIIEYNAGDVNHTFDISERPNNELLNKTWDAFNKEFDLSGTIFM